MTVSRPSRPDAPPPFPDRHRLPPSLGSSRTPPISSRLASLSVNSNLSRPCRPPTTSYSAPATQKGSFTPLSWNTCFDSCNDVFLSARNGTWRLYTAGFSSYESSPPPLIAVFLHGGGHSALSWALVSKQMKSHVPVVAFDARGHGHSHAESETQLDTETQVLDSVALLCEFLNERWVRSASLPKVVLCGHSMGGAIAIRIAATRPNFEIAGLVVIDVVEGTAMAALPYMSKWVADRAHSFPSVEKAIRYVTRAGHVRNLQSARISVPPQVKFSNIDRCWYWRTPLEKTQQFWKGWFDGLSPVFLSLPVPKMLILANVNRLDKDLMIAQMQGKFQNILIPSAGHAIHEDQPEQTARAILDYLRRNMLLEREEDLTNEAVFQQRKPIPPCC